MDSNFLTFKSSSKSTFMLKIRILSKWTFISWLDDKQSSLGISSSYGSASGFGKKEAGLNIPPSILNDNSKSMADISRKIQPSFGQGYGASS